MQTEDLYAILEPNNQLACWRGSQGVPFLSASLELTESTLQDPDVIDLHQGGQVIQVKVVALDDHVFVLRNESLLAVLRATDRSTPTSTP